MMWRKARIGRLDGGECGRQREQSRVGRQEDVPDISRQAMQVGGCDAQWVRRSEGSRKCV
jgi:hypothetical protein